MSDEERLHPGASSPPFAEALREGQLLVLEQIAAGDALPSVLATLAAIVEQTGPGTIVVPFVSEAGRLLPAWDPHALDPRPGARVLGQLHDAAANAVRTRRTGVTVDGEVRVYVATPVLGPAADVLGAFAIDQPDPAARQQAVELAYHFASLASVAIRTDQRDRSLRRSQEALATAQRVGRFGDLTVDPSSTSVAWSHQTYALYGRDPAEGPPPVDVFCSWHRGPDVDGLRAMLEGQGPAQFDAELAVVRDEAVVAYHRFVLAREAAGDEPATVTGTVHDVTERRRTEEAFQQAQRLESLGLLAGGVAHDFNNLLAAIVANLGLLERRVDRDEGARRLVSAIDRIVQRATDLTRQILAYAGRTQVRIDYVDFDKLAAELVDLLESTAPRAVRIERVFGADAVQVLGDSAQVQQVVMNLVKNAIDAIGDASGRVRVASTVEHLSEADAKARFPGSELRPGCFVVLTVSDDGCGMAPETASRIFDPFFTTKTSGRGLGLSAVRGILKAHGAGISIDSALGHGTTFRVAFPASELSAKTVEIPSERPAPRARPRVLLVEDEPALREAVAEVFSTAGYEVVACADGGAAVVEIGRGQVLEAVVSDLRMPVATGLEVHAALRATSTNCPFVLCTGYAGGSDLSVVEADPAATVVGKPVHPEELLRAVKRLRRAPSERSP